MSIGQGYYAPCCVDGHILMVTGMTHPLITFQEKIPTLPVFVRVGGFTPKPQQWAPGHKAVHAL